MLSFFVGQLLYTIISDAVIVWCLKSEEFDNKTYHLWLSLAWCIKMICIFVSCMTILYMFWRYKVAEKLIQKLDETEQLEEQPQIIKKENEQSSSPRRASKENAQD